MATMDDLIAMAGQLHMSQEALDINNFKAQLARTLVLPMPIPSSGSSPASDAPLPSPTSCGSSFGAFPFPSPPAQQAPTPAYQPMSASYEDDAALAAAFAGDAFAPMVQQKQDPWACFQPASPPQYQPPPPQYSAQPQQGFHQGFHQGLQPQAQRDADAMDADMAEAML